MANTAALAQRAFEEGGGVLRLAPTWVPRSFGRPGRRIKLRPDAYFPLGGDRGAICERWLSSTVVADNGPGTGATEGLSAVLVGDGRDPLLLAEAVAELGGELIGPRLHREYGGWTMFAKFFDYQGPLPFHLHHDDAHAARIGRRGKPEAYYFPPQLNHHLGDLPISFLGLRPGVDREEVLDRLTRFGSGDNRITELSAAYRLQLGTGWDIPPGVLHAPGSLCTYEAQSASDVLVMCECLADGRIVPEDLLWKDVPDSRHGDLRYLLELMDWPANTDPFFARNRFMPPLPLPHRPPGATERRIIYRSTAFSATELTVAPGATVTVVDEAAYGAIAVQGHGRFGRWAVSSPTMVHYGQPTEDEFFVAESAARQGVTVVNASGTEPLVLLKHFGPGPVGDAPLDVPTAVS